VRLHLPGRFERRGRAILDVAHNVEAAQVLADNLRAARVGRLQIVLGMLSDKPVEEFCAALAPCAAAFHAAGLPPPRGLDGATLARRAAAAKVPVTAHADVARAYAGALAQSRAGEPVLVCGSFLTVAAAQERVDG
jgi:dihydrofolate synthase/folylpolyglutamate synthase